MHMKNTFTLVAVISCSLFFGSKLSASIPDLVAAPPVAKFVSDIHGCVGYPVKFTNMSKNATEFVWSFGDGETSTDANPTHIFKTNGEYTVTLSVINKEFSDSAFKVNQVIVVNDVKVDFTIEEETSSEAPFTCSFYSKVNAPNVRYIWDFGDGSISNQSNPTHEFEVPGNFQVRLVAYTKSGCTANKVVTYTVHEGGQPSVVMLPAN